MYTCTENGTWAKGIHELEQRRQHPSTLNCMPTPSLTAKKSANLVCGCQEMYLTYMPEYVRLFPRLAGQCTNIVVCADYPL
jgi:hypothetical protein